MAILLLTVRVTDVLVANRQSRTYSKIDPPRMKSHVYLQFLTPAILILSSELALRFQEKNGRLKLEMVLNHSGHIKHNKHRKPPPNAATIAGERQ